jgi:hypothetical protein
VGAGGGVSNGVVGGVIAQPPAFSGAGATSMQTALEDRKVTEALDQYISALSKVIAGKGDVVGYAYTVNGKFSGAEVYASADLFRRIWPKLLHSSAAEALADRGSAAAPKPLDPAVIYKALVDAENGRPTAPRNNGSLSVTKRESNGSVLYVTTEMQAGGAWLHKSYIAK